MAYTLSNKCAKNLYKRTVLLQLIIKNVFTCFFLEHSVVAQYFRNRDENEVELQKLSADLACAGWPAIV